MIKKLFISIFIIFLLILQWFDLNSKFLANQALINNNIPSEIIEHGIENPNEIEPIVIVIDPGHGPKVNSDMEPISPDSSIMKRKYGTGAVGNVTGTMEREINLNVSLMIRDLLEKDGFVVIMTRTNHDVILSNIDRVNLANDNNADLMIRVHSDSHVNTSIHGASMLVPGEVGYATPIVDISRKYGEIVLNTLVNEVGMANRGVVTRTDQTGFNWSKIPIITVEMGFLSNPDEDKLLSTTEYQEKLAYALYKGISNCFKTE
jgi:N-acetylmuramoyl-L-alanine amidase